MAPAPVKSRGRKRAAVVVGDYFTDGMRLWMIRDLHEEGVLVENCKTTDVHFREFKWLAELERVAVDG